MEHRQALNPRSYLGKFIVITRIITMKYNIKYKYWTQKRLGPAIFLNNLIQNRTGQQQFAWAYLGSGGLGIS
jgi:hypothetical protein